MKTAHLLITFLFLITSLSTLSQDIIVKSNGREIRCKVKDISPVRIEYKKPGNPGGPSYYISVSEVSEIIYENGERTQFEAEEVYQQEPDTNYLYWEPGLFSPDIMMSGRLLSHNEVMMKYESCPRSLELYKSGNNMILAGYIIGIPSAVVFGWTVGVSISGRRPNPTAVVLSTIGYTASLFLTFAGSSRIKKSVTLYNMEKQDPAIAFKVEMGLTHNGFGVTVHF